MGGHEAKADLPVARLWYGRLQGMFSSTFLANTELQWSDLPLQHRSCCPSASRSTASNTPQAGQVGHIDRQTDCWGHNVVLRTCMQGLPVQLLEAQVHSSPSLHLNSLDSPCGHTRYVPAYIWMTMTRLAAAHSMTEASAQRCPADSTHWTALVSHHHHSSIILPLL